MGETIHLGSTGLLHEQQTAIARLKGELRTAEGRIQERESRIRGLERQLTIKCRLLEDAREGNELARNALVQLVEAVRNHLMSSNLDPEDVSVRELFEAIGGTK